MPKAEQIYHKREDAASVEKVTPRLTLSGLVLAPSVRARLAESHNDLRIKFYTDDGSAPPASTWIGCTCLAVPGLLLEVECIAELG